MDQVTQQNAALVEEAAAATDALANQAEHLSGVVSVFNLETVGNEDVTRDLVTNGVLVTP